LSKKAKRAGKKGRDFIRKRAKKGQSTIAKKVKKLI
jgi:hypothetical protein